MSKVRIGMMCVFCDSKNEWCLDDYNAAQCKSREEFLKKYTLTKEDFYKEHPLTPDEAWPKEPEGKGVTIFLVITAICIIMSGIALILAA